jgi:hypothetical protein
MKASLIISGPGIRQGEITSFSHPGGRLIDVAPTVAHLLGFAMPDVDGRSLDVLAVPSQKK